MPEWLKRGLRWLASHGVIAIVVAFLLAAWIWRDAIFGAAGQEASIPHTAVPAQAGSGPAAAESLPPTPALSQSNVVNPRTTPVESEPPTLKWRDELRPETAPTAAVGHGDPSTATEMQSSVPAAPGLSPESAVSPPGFGDPASGGLTASGSPWESATGWPPPPGDASPPADHGDRSALPSAGDRPPPAGFGGVVGPPAEDGSPAFWADPTGVSPFEYRPSVGPAPTRAGRADAPGAHGYGRSAATDASTWAPPVDPAETMPPTPGMPGDRRVGGDFGRPSATLSTPWGESEAVAPAPARSVAPAPDPQRVSDGAGPSVDRLVVVARRAFWSGEYAAAEEAYRRATQADPAGPDAYGELGNLYVYIGRVDEAPPLFLEAGRRLVALGRFAEASRLVGFMRESGAPEANVLERLLYDHGLIDLPHSPAYSEK